MNTKRCFTLLAGLLLPAGCAPAAVNPHVAYTVSIPYAGPMVFDGTYMWVASFDLITAVNPATGAIVASQSILGTQFIAYDAPTGTLWLEGGSQNVQMVVCLLAWRSIHLLPGATCGRRQVQC